MIRPTVAAIQDLAVAIDSNERTLRRAVAEGAVRGRRLGPRRLRIAPEESAYLKTHWQLLTELRELLRTERQVSFAVLFGSVARGDDGPDSDLDLLVGFRPGGGPRPARRLTRKLRSALGREVDMADADDVEQRSPLLLSRAVEEGRSLVDRDGRWQGLRDERKAIRARGDRAYRREMAEATKAIADLRERT
jgi:hypothetical protein